MRHAFDKFGGNLGTTGSVAFQFERKGQIIVNGPADEDELMLAAADAGADDVVSGDGSFQVLCPIDVFGAVRDAIEAAGFAIDSAELTMVAKVTVDVTDEAVAKRLMKLMDVLEDNDDVQEVFANFDIPEEILEVIAG